MPVVSKATNTDVDTINRSNKQKFTLHIVLSLCTLFLSVLFGVHFSQKPMQQNCDKSVQEIEIVEKKPIYWVFSQHSNVESKSGILKHVHLVLNRIGFDCGTNQSDWDLLWSHDYPFRTLYQHIKSMKPNQLVNHFPGTGYITNKVDFATTTSKYIPKAFKIPQDNDKLLEYVTLKPDALFVQKDNQHRGVTIEKISEIDLKKDGNFVQEYIQKPYLVDGHKFDIGVYTIVTSVDPLRLYIYKGDVLFRYCPSKYYPFDAKDLDKYVIGDDYLPTWEVPSLAPLYTAMGYGMKDSFEAYVREQGKDPSVIWEQIDEFIAEMFLDKEHLIVSGLKNFRTGANFFELMRFDFVIDEDLKVSALEANMSPNLSSAHYPPNQLLYEQVLYSVLSLVGAGRYTRTPSLADRNPGETSMRVSDKNLGVWSKECSSSACRDSCDGVCSACRHCLTASTRAMLARAYTEHVNRNDCRRVYPPPMKQGVEFDKLNLSYLTPRNQLMYLWTQGKCNVDVTWCN